MNMHREALSSPVRTGLIVLAVGGVGKAIYNKLAASRTQPEADMVNGIPFTKNQFERGSYALYPFVDAWKLPLNPEDLETMAYAVLKHAANPDPIASTEGYQQIADDVTGMIEEEKELHRQMIEAMQRSIDERRSK